MGSEMGDRVQGTASAASYLRPRQVVLCTAYFCVGGLNSILLFADCQVFSAHSARHVGII